ncbi:MAG: endolytic transglycosylase MltG [Candidatus Methylomirabilales bacterium]
MRRRVPLPEVLLLILFVAAQAFSIRSYLASDFEAGGRLIVYIEPGTGAWRIAEVLQEAGVVRSRLLFLFVAFARGSHGRLRPGEYEFHPRMSLLEVLRKLERGEVLIHQVTIPEGFTVKEIGRLLAAEGLVDEGRFLATASDRALVGKYGLEGDSFEGYLFPDTYHLTKGMTEEAIIQVMLTRFRQVFGPAEEERAKALRMTLREVITLASLIEKEAHVSEERALISAVFHNRLKLQMPLQSDPTVIYALPEFSGRLRRADLATPSPYNTYLHQGLPPGPIGNPGLASIQAVLEPAQTDYLYFMARGDGTHAFARTLEEHIENVRKYSR